LLAVGDELINYRFLHTTSVNALGYPHNSYSENNLPNKAKPDMSDQLCTTVREEPSDTPIQALNGQQDPCETLPLEIMMSIMQHGLDQDRYFVLKSSWVSKFWRNTLNNACPELWSNFETSALEMKDKTKNDMREAWVQRSGGRLTTMNLRRLNLTSVGQLQKTLNGSFEPVENLLVDVKTPDVLVRFINTIKPSTTFAALKRLNIVGGAYGGTETYYNRFREQIPAGQPIHCDFIGPAARETLESLEVRGMFYQQSHDAPQVSAEIHRFPALKRLSFQHCMMDYSHSPNPLPSAEMDYQQDPLHDLLRGADRLERLDAYPCVSRSSIVRDPVPRAQDFRRVEMPRLLSAKVPPPSV
jgi:hypothetical protein